MNEMQMILGLVVGVFLLIFLVLKTKIHTFIALIIATVIRLIQVSGTVSMITAASISAPILASLSINPVFATMSACMGAMVFSYFNDSLFWVVTRMVGITDVREQVRSLI